MSEIRGSMLNPSDFPVTITAYTVGDRECIWGVCLPNPGTGKLTGLYVPPLAKEFGRPVTVRVEFATGEVSETGPYAVPPFGAG